jgi:hypothetical protein
MAGAMTIPRKYLFPLAEGFMRGYPVSRHGIEHFGHCDHLVLEGGHPAPKGADELRAAEPMTRPGKPR